MRPRELFGSLLVIAFLVIPTMTLAGIPTGPPPGPPPTYGVHSFDCNYCHGADMDLSSVTDMICLKCHRAGGAAAQAPPAGWPADGFPRDGVTDREFSGDDASNAMGYNNSATLQTSHNWATPTNYVPAAGAEAPQGAGFQTNYGATGSKIACSTCHLPHEDTTNPQLLALGEGNVNAMCVDCHRSWNQGPNNDGVLTHPMVSDYTPYSTQPGFKPMPLVNPANANVALLPDNSISCTTCHGVHWVDSDSSTVDGYDKVVNPGDGNLLRADGTQITVNISGPSTPMGSYPTGGSVCTVCHDYESSFHGTSNNVGCLACHGGHNYNNGNPPVYMLNDSTGSYTSIPADNDAKSIAWVGNSLGTIDGFCETCHGDIQDWDSSRNHLSEYPGEDCTACHGAHDQGSFSEPIGCDGCHGSPPQFDAPGKPGATGFVANGYAYANSAGLTPVDAVAAGIYPDPYSYEFSDVNTSTANTEYKDESATPHTTHSGTSSLYGFQCTVCHNTHIDEFNTTHNKGPDSFQDVLQSGYSFVSLTNAGGDLTPGYDNSAVLGTCSSVYCHSDGGLNDGDGNRTYGAPNVAATWAGQLDQITGQPGATRCQACHGNDSGEMESSTHDTHLNAGFSCDNCHFNTAESNLALTAAAPGGAHVNGTIDIAFDTTNPLKSAGAVVSNGSNPYSDAAQMTCTNLYCHSTGQDAVPADRQYKTLNWDDSLPVGAARCTSCHDITTGTDQTAAHAAHIDGSTSFVGRDLACATCHDLTMDSGSDDALGAGGLAYHVNGKVDIALPATIDPESGDCSTALCHSDGNLGSTTDFSGSGYNAKFNTPAWTSAPLSLGCADCHGDGTLSYPSYASGGAGTEDSNSHFKHVDASESNIACEECHSTTSVSGTALDGSDVTQHVDQTIDVDFKQGGSYADGTDTCSTTYCHGSGEPQWGGNVNCGDCHAVSNVGGNALANSHGTHYESTSAGSFAETNTSVAGTYQINCGICHSLNQGTVHAGGTANTNYAAEVNFDGTIASGTYTAGGTYVTDPNGFDFSNATCSNLYCHGNFGGNGNNPTPTWNSAASGDCGTCHDVDTSAVMNGGKHNTHVKTIGMTCDYCHGATAVNAAGGIADKSLHVDQALNWDLDESKNEISASSTYSGSNAGTIAKADVGSLPYGNCNNIYCHSDVQASPPNGTTGVTYNVVNWNGTVNCGDCHDAGPAGGVTEQSSGSHLDHVSTSAYNIACSDCHLGAGSGTTNHANYSIDVTINNSWGASANYGGTAVPGDAYGGCASVYCHSDAQGNYNNPTWGTTINDCVSCHDGAVAGTGLSGAHAEHFNGATLQTIGKALGCADCHTSTVSDNTTIADYSLHVNGGVEVDSCATNLCHSDGNFGNDLVQYNPDFATDTLDCFNCHGDGTSKSHPTYANVGPADDSSNSHVAHVETSAISCEECHDDTSTAGTSIDGATPAQHVDGGIDVVFKQTGSYADGTDTCSTTYCHGAGTPVWGGAALDCDACHSASSALADSHGVHYNSSSVATSISTVNNSTTLKYIFECGNCHNGTIHAGGEANAGIQSAEVSLAGTGAYTPDAASAGTDNGFNYTSGTCNTNDCHNDGTAAKGAPNVAAPEWSVDTLDCTGCHNSNAAATGNEMATGSHGAHINDGSIMSNASCQSCHDDTLNASDISIADKTVHVNGLINVAILGSLDKDVNPNNNYNASDECSNVYCHSDGKSGGTWTGVTVTWGDTINDCVSCHEGATAGTTLSGAHEAHVVNATATIGMTLGCVDCHNAVVSDNTTISTPAQHVDGGVDVASCATNDCHSDGNFGADLSYKPPTWTANYDCDDCHGDSAGKAYPDYANGGVGDPSANSHPAHMVGGGFACGDCHKQTSTVGTSIDGADPAQHVDGGIDVNGDDIGGFAGGTCSTIVCHGNNDADWGDTLGCSNCHTNATTDTDNWTYNDGTVAVIALDEWNYSGHGLAAASTYQVTGRSGADFDTEAGTGDACLYCHDSSISHGAANYFRLRDNSFTYNSNPDLNGACRACHETGTTSYDPDGAGGPLGAIDVSSTVKIDKFHGGADHNATDRDDGRWCWDCHDPHGDADGANQRIQMVQRNPHNNPNAFGVPDAMQVTEVIFYDNTIGVGAGAFARDITGAGAAAGICNSCHTSTDQYTQTTGKGTHPDSRCTDCHKHSENTTYNEFAFAGSGCNGCHGGSYDHTDNSFDNTNYWPDGVGGNAEDDDGRHTKHMAELASTVYGETLDELLDTANGDPDAKQKALCLYCHDTPGGANHLSGLPADVNSMYRIWNFGAGADDGVYATANGGTCATVDCHFNKATTTTAGDDYAWYGADTTNCVMCHVDVPTDATSHTLHISGLYSQISCDDCHVGSPTWVDDSTQSAPTVNHINGTFLVTSTDRTFIYNAGTGSCGTNECHNDGNMGTPNTSGYDWAAGDTSAHCQTCHDTLSPPMLTEGHKPHMDAAFDNTTEQFVSSPFSCSDCHSHSSGSAADHLSNAIDFDAAITYSGDVDINVSASYGNCSTALCHNAGDQTTAVPTPQWDRTPTSVDDCYLCHADVLLPDSHPEHIGTIGATSYIDAQTNQSTSGEYRFDCGLCHGATVANHIDGGPDFVDYNGYGVASDWDGVTCNNNACHQDETGGAANLSANWTTGWVSDSDGDSCNNCHGNSPTTNAHGVHEVGIHYEELYDDDGDGLMAPGASSGAAHGDDVTSDPISCQTCHNNTVTVEYNAGNSTCTACHSDTNTIATGDETMVIADKSVHVDGSKDVAFADMATFKSRAQLRDDIESVSEVGTYWDRNNGYKAGANSFDTSANPGPAAFAGGSCSSISCHNGNAATWTDSNVDCMYCHTSLPQ